jgi:hypothetical protein
MRFTMLKPSPQPPPERESFRIHLVERFEHALPLLGVESGAVV